MATAARRFSAPNLGYASPQMAPGQGQQYPFIVLSPGMQAMQPGMQAMQQSPQGAPGQQVCSACRMCEFVDTVLDDDGSSQRRWLPRRFHGTTDYAHTYTYHLLIHALIGWGSSKSDAGLFKPRDVPQLMVTLGSLPGTARTVYVTQPTVSNVGCITQTITCRDTKRVHQQCYCNSLCIA